MRALWRLLQLILGLGAGFLLGYGAITWLIEQDRRLRAAPDAGAADAAAAAPPRLSAATAGQGGLWDKTLTRFRLALDEGRRAAAAARAELEAEIAGTARSGPAL